MRLLALLGACSFALAQSPKDRKIGDIDPRIIELQKEIDGLKALRASISSGELPDSAIEMIVVNPQPIPAATTPAVASALADTKVAQPISTLKAVTPPKTRPTGYYLGPRGGCYTLSANGNKRYIDRSMCQ